jgi:hypothetical protein
MNDTDLQPLTDEMAKLLEAEARRPPRPPEEGDAVLARLSTSLASAAGGSGGSDPGATPPAAGAGSGFAAILRDATRGLPRSLAIAAISFLLGGGVGGGIVAHYRPLRDAPPLVLVTPPASPAPTIVASTDGGLFDPPARSFDAVDAGPPGAAAPRAATKSPEMADAYPRGTLAEEVALIEGARDAMKRGDNEAALARLAVHAKRFATGQLVEEREALRVRALHSGRGADEARDAARAFRERFPNSVFARDLDAGIDGGP